ncbi:hypothetical protein OCO53_06090 [Peribacillus frigoritolerans]|uniref:hypothetical protein n=1 Tax=Peribacillus frigoritolerans TaxID=450367 RepID=UPI0021CFF462|nr:hypothetical protein [Peribacillus frigoritolerans]MCU6600036.1 hypothetical protein [Peribacillus frigoritolerans]
MDENLKVIKNKALSTELDLHGVAIDSDIAEIIETKTNSISVYKLKNTLERMKLDFHLKMTMFATSTISIASD